MLRMLLRSPRPPSEYFELTGLEALLFDDAIERVRTHVPMDDPLPQIGLTLRG